jgi:hypothetical protein
MRRYLLLGIFLISLSGSYYLIMRDGLWVKHYRTTENVTINKSENVNLRGVEKLRISGSNLIIFSDLKRKLSHITGPIYILDLTGNGHSYYKDYPTTFLGMKKPHPGIVYLLRRFIINGFAPLDLSQVQKEHLVAEKNGFKHQYLSLERRGVPTPEMVDQLINFLKDLPKDAWIHLHCLAGKGRTTSVMVMIDILKNGRFVKLEDIVKRHHLMGGVDLFDTQVWENGTYTQEQLTRRKEFIVNFYQYVNDPSGYGIHSWREWCDKNHINPSAPLY